MDIMPIGIFCIIMQISRDEWSFSLPRKYFYSQRDIFRNLLVQLKFQVNAIGIIQYFSKAVSHSSLHLQQINYKYSCLLTFF